MHISIGWPLKSIEVKSNIFAAARRSMHLTGSNGKAYIGTHFRYLDLVHITVGKRDPPAGSFRLLDNSRPPVSEVHLIVNFPSRQELDHESFGMIESQC